MKKRMKTEIAGRLVDGIGKGVVAVDREGTVTIKGKEAKRGLSQYILKKMRRMGARLNDAGFYEVAKGRNNGDGCDTENGGQDGRDRGAGAVAGASHS